MKLSTLVPEFSVHETRWVDCPFVKGLRIEIARIGCDEYVSWARENLKESAYFRKLTNAVGAVSAATAGGNPGLAEKIAAKVDVSEEMTDALAGEKEREGVARYLMRNWEGELVKEIPYSPEEAIELMADTVPLGVDVELLAAKEKNNLEIGEREPIGRAVTLWVKWEAEQHERYREDWIEDQAKNSEPLSTAQTA
jgi:hypothetical protein